MLAHEYSSSMTDDTETERSLMSKVMTKLKTAGTQETKKHYTRRKVAGVFLAGVIFGGGVESGYIVDAGRLVADSGKIVWHVIQDASRNSQKHIDSNSPKTGAVDPTPTTPVTESSATSVVAQPEVFGDSKTGLSCPELGNATIHKGNGPDQVIESVNPGFNDEQASQLLSAMQANPAFNTLAAQLIRDTAHYDPNHVSITGLPANCVYIGG
jgi:hypothetical protein